jgi:hypothetical protein
MINAFRVDGRRTGRGPLVFVQVGFTTAGKLLIEFLAQSAAAPWVEPGTNRIDSSKQLLNPAVGAILIEFDYCIIATRCATSEGSPPRQA